LARDGEGFLEGRREAGRASGLTGARLTERLDQTRSSVSQCERAERRLGLVKPRSLWEASGIAFTGFVAALEARRAMSDRFARSTPSARSRPSRQGRDSNRRQGEQPAGSFPPTPG
jgi:hypothetical protein